jgi:hypothetical protein
MLYDASQPTSPPMIKSHRFSPPLFQSTALLLFAIGMAVMRSAGSVFSGPALLIILAATLLIGISLWRSPGESNHRIVDVILIVTLIFAFTRLPPLIQLYLQFPNLPDNVAGDIAAFFWLACASAALVILLLLDWKMRISSIVFPFLLLAHLFMAFAFLDLSKNPRIDVYLIQMLGADAMVHGVNPYTITFPDLYSPNAGFYPAKLIVNGQIQCGYFYLPMSLLLALPGFLAGDVRYTNLLSLTIAAALIAYARPSRRSFLAAAIVLFLPGSFYILENAWIEPQLLMLLAAAVFVVVRELRFNRITRFILLGCFLATKQYAVLATPLIALLEPDRIIKSLARAFGLVAIVAALIIAPFFLWNPTAFLHSTIALYVGILRTDALSITAWLKLKFGIQSNLLITAGIALAASIVIALRTRPAPTIFAAAMSFVLTIAFLFSTQAFLNYYFLSACTLCIAIAVNPPNRDPL